MKPGKLLISAGLVVTIVMLGHTADCAPCEPWLNSEFDEEAIREIRSTSPETPEFSAALQAFGDAATDSEKTATYEQLLLASAEDMLGATPWTPPPGGWKLFEFGGEISLQEVATQQSYKTLYTKVVAANETEAAKLRGLRVLAGVMAAEGEIWAEDLLLDIAQRPDDDLKRLIYWSTDHFGEDMVAPRPSRAVDWTKWQAAFDAANQLGKAIILRNVVMLAVRKNDFATAAAIHSSIFSGADRELKAIALAFSSPHFGQTVIDQWKAIAADGSDAELQALAQELLEQHEIE